MAALSEARVHEGYLVHPCAHGSEKKNQSLIYWGTPILPSNANLILFARG
jgi:hypothetical protein